MSSPLETIKEGILSNDMHLVAKGYQMMTGEHIKLDNEFDVADVKIEEPVVEPQGESPRDAGHENFYRQIRQPQQQQRTIVDENGEEHTLTIRQPINTKKIGAFNMYEDDGQSHKSDTEQFDKKVWAGRSPSQRRPPTKKVEATCTDCKRRYKVHPAHQFKRSFTCQTCLKRKSG